MTFSSLQKTVLTCVCIRPRTWKISIVWILNKTIVAIENNNIYIFRFTRLKQLPASHHDASKNLWTEAVCCFRLDLRANRLSQMTHMYLGCWPHSNFKCLVNELRYRYTRPQDSFKHRYMGRHGWTNGTRGSTPTTWYGDHGGKRERIIFASIYIHK